MKTIFTTIFLIISLSLWAQVETNGPFNNWIVGSEFNVFTNNEVGGVISNDFKLKTTSFTIAPYIGKKLNANWLVGLQIGYKKTDEVEDFIIDLGLDPSTGFTQTTVTAIEVNQKEFSFGTFARRYFRLTNKLQAFVHTSLGYSIQNQDDFFIEDTKDWRFSLGVSPGVSWNISKRINIISKFSSASFRFGKRKRAAYESEIIVNGSTGFIEGDLGNYAIPDGYDVTSGTSGRLIQSGLETSYSEFNTNFGMSSFFIGVEFKW